MRKKPGAGGGQSGSLRGKGLGGDQVEGRQAVRELLLAGTRRTREVIFAADMDQAQILDEIIDLADEAKVPLREISRTKFEAMARTDAPQGVLAHAAPLQPVELDELAARKGATLPFLLVLDGVTDPQNLGSILRVAECAGVTGVVLPRHRAARITASVTKTAAGAVEHLPMAQVAGIPAALQRLKELEVWTVGLDMVADTTIFDIRVATDPVALVLGAEGSGISRLARERCDVVVRIPLAGSLGSLNVSTAAAVACYEVVRRRTE
jgi:23S rRNA (guanosine2251-2'-O)-methyltransferase